jgi:hypothetical protein
MRLQLILILIFLQIMNFYTDTSGQTSSSQQIEYEYVHSPHKATIFSAVLPGLGQFYNKKYWKIPIVYTGIGVIGYFALENRSEYRKANEAYIYVFNNETYEIDNDLINRYNSDKNVLREIRDYYRRNMELSYIFLALWYGLNIIDATVDAHLFNYDVGDNLSLQIEPTLMPDFAIRQHHYSPFAPPGIRLKINF